MGETFEDLGLRPELLRAVESAGFGEPSALQRATIPVLRRGGNAVIHASSGSGVTTAWGLSILDRLAEREGTAAAATAEGSLGDAAPLRALAVVPTPEAAGRAAAQLAPLAAAAGVRLLALAPGWAAPRQSADLIIASAQDLAAAVERSALKLDQLIAFVVAGASSVLAFRGAEPLETLVASIPHEAQRVLTSTDFPPEVENWIERHVRRALRIPPRPADESPAGEATGEVAYAVVGEESKLDWAAENLEPGTVLFCRSDERAAVVAEQLTLRGFAVGAAGDRDADVAVAAAHAEPEQLPAERAVSYDVPFDATQLRARHGGRGGAVLVLAREVAHLRRIAREAGLALRPQDGAAAPLPGLDTFRQRLRDALREEDLEAQFLVLEPLLQERSAAEIAAAACALLRRRPQPSARAAAPAEAGGQRSGQAAARGPRASAAAGAPPDSYTRLFVSIGQRDNVRPGDLVGAIAGEAGLPGDRVGKIEVRDTFSIVEVPADAAERIIRAVNGITLKGRSVRVDYDRRRAAVPRRPGPGRLRRE